MDFNTYRALALRTESPGEDHDRLLHAVCGLVSEYAELAAHSSKTNYAEELGDMTWYCAILDDSLAKWSHESTDKLKNPCGSDALSLIGEIADAAKRCVFYKKPLEIDRVRRDLKALLTAITIMAQEADVSMSQVFKANIAKLKNRYPDRFESGLVDSRDTAAEEKIVSDHL
jgi:NTP pyrophosphatase (non-canonical NTP hydrolase)